MSFLHMEASNIACPVQCSADHVPILQNVLHVENLIIPLQLLGSQSGNVLYIIQNVQLFNMHSKMKSCSFLVSQPSIKLSWL